MNAAQAQGRYLDGCFRSERVAKILGNCEIVSDSSKLGNRIFVIMAEACANIKKNCNNSQVDWIMRDLSKQFMCRGMTSGRDVCE